jgi:S-adenosylmethionine:tRNA ribosyltransferase-isomerase
MIDLEKYDYHLPEELIRKRGVEPRDAARLFVYDTKRDEIVHATFSELAKFLPEHSLMVLNNTKVVPARLFLKKETGGKIEVFVLTNEIPHVIPASEPESRSRIPLRLSPLCQSFSEAGEASKSGMTHMEIPVLVDRKCLPGWKLYFPNGEYFEVVRQEENIFFVELRSKKSLEEMLTFYGETPIPHYLEEEIPRQARDDREAALRRRYQTVFAREGASVAAPTASLHFTDRVFRSLDEKHIERTEVTLNVGLGTFAPLKEEHFRSGKLHSETVSVSEEAAEKIGQAKRDGRPVIAVGTTAVRTLESVASVIPGLTRNLDSRLRGNDKVKAFSGKTNIFIYPPYDFQVADILLTNFHLPKSSLMLLVDAFLERKGARRRIVDLYQEAIKEGYAFYSFGDSMLIL